jgi:hypothetical protein
MTEDFEIREAVTTQASGSHDDKELIISETPNFENVSVPGAEGGVDSRTLLGAIERWIDSPPLRALLQRFDAPSLPSNLLQKLKALEAFTATAWDFRRTSEGSSVERNQVRLDAIGDPETEALVLSAATALGLVKPRPPLRQEYDYVVVLGGLVRANLWRSEFAAHLLNAGIVRSSKVVALTANRPLAANAEDPDRDEYKLLERFGLPTMGLESEVMAEAIRRAFGLHDLAVRVADADDVPVPARRLVAGATSGDVDVTLVVAPPSDPASGQRADTAATYKFWAEDVEHIAKGAHLLVITSCIYVPYHALVALQHLGVPFRATVETVGFDDAIIDVSLAPQIFRAVNYLQEIRSTLRAATTLAAAVGA